MRTTYAEDDDMPEEEGSPDAWFSGYLEGREEVLMSLWQALGRHAPKYPNGDPLILDSAIVEAVVKLAANS